MPFINDLTGKTWIYMISRKSDTFNVFKNLKAFVEKHW